MTTEPIGPTHAEIIEADGVVARIHGDAPLNAEGRAAAAEVIRAARARFASERPTEEEIAQWAGRIQRMPMSAARSWAARLHAELVAERERNSPEPLGYLAGFFDLSNKRITIESDAGQAFATRERAQRAADELNTPDELDDGESARQWCALEIRKVRRA